MANKKGHSQLIAFCLGALLIAAPGAHATSCESPALGGAKQENRESLPDWVTNSVGIDKAWWQGLNETDRESLSILQLTDGATVPIGPFLRHGRFGSVHCLNESCEQIIKIPIDGTGENLTEELRLIRLHERIGLNVPKTQTQQLPVKGVPYLVREKVSGMMLISAIEKGLSDAQIQDLARIYRLNLFTGIYPDVFGKGNMLWDASISRWILVDSGPPPAQFVSALLAWPRYMLKGHPETERRFFEYIHGPTPATAAPATGSH